MSIRAVILDFGGVLYFTPSLVWARRWQAIMGLKEDPFISAMLSAPDEFEIVKDINVGRIPESQVWEAVARRWKISPVLVNKFMRATLSGKRWNRDLAKFVQGLRPQYRTAILSNAGSDARQTFTRAYKIDDLVDDIIISAEEKVAKPDKQIYQIAVDRLGVEPHEFIFVDDLSQNVEAARQFGMHGVHFRSTDQAITEMQQLLG